ncbi:hypothetical protein ACPOL_5736 [Acidisarcina polymorpha]|uniref:Uncharacterized protein n=1 Tax=Acidisarcina polymorpha TaxID=2211140 RepID=A0A2Z5G6V7_9BACT|nr:hypothetical protein ACPOL_5736 [Acidisarcina polymorpha]
MKVDSILGSGYNNVLKGTCRFPPSRSYFFAASRVRRQAKWLAHVAWNSAQT